MSNKAGKKRRTRTAEGVDIVCDKSMAKVFFKAADLAEKDTKRLGFAAGACDYINYARHKSSFTDGYTSEYHEIFGTYFKEQERSFWLNEYEPEYSNEVVEDSVFWSRRGNLVRQIALQLMAEMINSGMAPDDPEQEHMTDYEIDQFLKRKAK